jgi:O-antigen/teichoic acid export membrane protein
MIARLSLLRRAGRELMAPRGGFFAMLQTLLTQGAILLLNVATGIITARWLGPTGRGEFAAACLWLVLPPMIATAGARNAVVYFTGRDPAQAGPVGIVALLYATAIFTPIAAVAYWFTPELMHDYSPRIVALARAIVILSVVNVWSVMGRQSLLAEKDYRAFNLASYASTVLYLLLLLLLVASKAVTPGTAAIAQVLAVAVVLIPIGVLVNRAWRRRGAWARCPVREVIVYSIKAAPIDVVNVLGTNIDRVVLVGLVSAHEFGLYTVAISFARMLYVLQNVISAVMLTDLAAKTAAEIQHVVHWVFRVLLWGFALGFVIALALDAPLLGWVYGHAFAEAAPVFRVLLLEAIFSNLAYMLVQAYLAAGKPAFPSLVQTGTFGVAICGVLLLAPRFGGMGAATALAVASAVRFVWLFGSLRRIGVSLPSPVPQLRDLEPLRRRVQSKFARRA